MATLMGNAGIIAGVVISTTDYDDFGFRWEFDYDLVEHDVSRFLDTGLRMTTSVARSRARVYFWSDSSVVNKLPLGIGGSITLRLSQESGQYYEGTFLITRISTAAQQTGGAPPQQTVYEGPFTVTASATLPVSAT